MMTVAGLSVAYCAKPAVLEYADIVISAKIGYKNGFLDLLIFNYSHMRHVLDILSAN
jgi:hypothetical protein